MYNDPYATLGIQRDASSDEIKQAYRKLARVYHPDTGGSADDFSRLNDAFECLSDPVRREQFDQFGVLNVKDLDERRKKVLECIAGALDYVLAKLQQDISNTKIDDFLNLMIDYLNGRRAEIILQRSIFLTALGTAQELVNRHQKKKDMLSDVLAKRIEACEERLAILDHDIIVIDLALADLRPNTTSTVFNSNSNGSKRFDWVDVYSSIG